jgi:uncharacterized protein YecE (DUF72 family)
VDDPRLSVGTSGWSYPDAVEIRHRGWLWGEFSRLLKRQKTALVLADLHSMPTVDRITTDFTHIRLLGKPNAISDNFSRVRLDRGPEVTLWAGRIREYLGSGPTVCTFANNRLRGHAPARALLARVASAGSDP